MNNSEFTIIFFSHHDFESHEITGGTRRLLELIEGFVNEGIKVVLFSPKSDFISKKTNIQHFEIKQIKKSILPLGLINFIINYRFVTERLRGIKYDRSVGIDVPYGIQMKFYGFKNMCFIVWQDFINYRNIAFEDNNKNRLVNSLFIKFYRISESIVLKYAKKIIVQCNYDIDVLKLRHRNLSGDLDAKTDIIPNNINPSWIKAISDYEDRNKDRDGKFIISFIGNISDSRKGLFFLLEAFTKSTILKEKCILRIIGGGDKLLIYEKDYKEHSNIEFLGYQNFPLPMLCNSDLLVVPSVADSFPNTILEALYYEIPVLGSKKGGIPEVLLFEELLFELNVDDLRIKIEKLLNKSNYETVKQKCKTRREELSFNWVESMLEIIKKD
ncbi:glycosyltransferase [Flavobacterium bomense]|uniref:Glycosyltransferase n=1 Tax=Flavobacterium bomense TaxID=2497483 RepID=A0A3S0MIY0_9FLAO|nr:MULTISPECIES: glycosyltransferase family 4 protein [Flavobacterium]RTY66261.1 glycosyltransferase [Flavobacterium sp. LB2P53]RTZ05511.1 glycosyltransferase [Flavobacterium bomense]